ncbi:hypothetical protein IWX90DRAFT_102296 [Phyllosticta citrichinensis]|uniref:Uncharacterized protein n=1 Tax=Phyllosticta citrichinensis TaxID=1130410 RepID=A0ABR1Y2M3_9PEZI
MQLSSAKHPHRSSCCDPQLSEYFCFLVVILQCPVFARRLVESTLTDCLATLLRRSRRASKIGQHGDFQRVIVAVLGWTEFRGGACGCYLFRKYLGSTLAWLGPSWFCDTPLPSRRRTTQPTVDEAVSRIPKSVVDAYQVKEHLPMPPGLWMKQMGPASSACTCTPKARPSQCTGRVSLTHNDRSPLFPLHHGRSCTLGEAEMASENLVLKQTNAPSARARPIGTSPWHHQAAECTSRELPLHCPTNDVEGYWVHTTCSSVGRGSCGGQQGEKSRRRNGASTSIN